MKLLFLDLETTGTNPGKHGIHQISGQIVIDGIVKESFDFHVQPNPKAIIEDEALAVAGVTREQVSFSFACVRTSHPRCWCKMDFLT